MVIGVRFGQLRELAGSSPIELSGIDYNPSQRGSVSADELRGGMYHNIRSVFHGTNEVRCPERIVYNQRNAVTVGNIRYFLQINQVAIRIAEGLDENGLRMLLNCLLEVIQIARVDKRGRHSIDRQGISQQVIGSSVDSIRRHDVVSLTGDILDGIRNGSRTGSHRQGRHSPFQRSNPLFEHSLCRVRQTTVNISSLFQTEAGSGMGRIAENVRSGLVNGYGTGIGRRIRLFLSHVQLQSLEM